MDQRLTRLELALSERFSECSIVAAEAAKTAQQQVTDFGVPKNLHVIGSDLGPIDIDTLYAPVSRVVDTRDGRHVQLGLFAPQNDNSRITLAAVTRGDLAVPLAQFTRRENSDFCDYVQIGPEMDDDNFIVTLDNEISRREVVDLIRDVVSVNPAKIEATGYSRYGEDYGYRKEELDYDDMRKIEKRVQKLAQSSKIMGSDVLAKANMDRVALAQVIASELGDRSLLFVDGLISGSYPWAKRRLEKSKQALKDFLRNPSIHRFENGDFPGSDDNLLRPYFRRAVVYRLAEGSPPYKKEKVKQLVDVLGVRDKLDKLLGETTPKREAIFAKLADISMTGATVELNGLIRNMPFARIVGNVALQATVRPHNGTAVIVSVSARPDAINSGFEHVYDYILDRAAPTDIDDVELDELDRILAHVN